MIGGLSDLKKKDNMIIDLVNSVKNTFNETVYETNKFEVNFSSIYKRIEHPISWKQVLLHPGRKFRMLFFDLNLKRSFWALCVFVFA